LFVSTGQNNARKRTEVKIMNGIELHTFSITAKCKRTGMFGVAVSTARPAVGGLVPYVQAGVGAIATQALVNPYVGIDGLQYLSEHHSAEDVKGRLIEADGTGDLEKRQFAIVDANGNCEAFTGNKTVPWSGHKIGDGYVAAGNMLVGEDTILKMAESFEADEDVELPDRLLRALCSAQKAGGDKRGKQSAALYVVHNEDYPLVDLRVDDHDRPVDELIRIFEVCQSDLFPYMRKAPKRIAKASDSQ
jgi:uncharacterized Ntn-hydrolase superfamily protein